MIKLSINGSKWSWYAILLLIIYYEYSWKVNIPLDIKPHIPVYVTMYLWIKMKYKEESIISISKIRILCKYMLSQLQVYSWETKYNRASKFRASKCCSQPYTLAVTEKDKVHLDTPLSFHLIISSFPPPGTSATWNNTVLIHHRAEWWA